MESGYMKIEGVTAVVQDDFEGVRVIGLARIGKWGGSGDQGDRRIPDLGAGEFFDKT